MVFEVEPALVLSIFTLLAWGVFSTGEFLKLLGLLQSSHWFVDGVSNEDAEIAAAVCFGVFGEEFVVVFGHGVGGVLHSSFEHAKSE